MEKLLALTVSDSLGSSSFCSVYTAVMNPSTLTGKHFEERFQVVVPDSCVKRDVETQRFGNDFTISNAPKRRYLCANCVPTRYCNCVSSWQLRVNRLHHAMLWYLAAGNASMACAAICNIHTGMPVFNL